MILGVDPGSYNLGMGLLTRRGEYVTSLVLKQTNKDLRTRMEILYNLFSAHVDEWEKRYAKIHFCILENLYYYKYPKAVIVLAEMRGIILSIAFQKSWTILEPSPSEIKKGVLHGKASKLQVQYMINQILGTMISEEDESDALATAYWGVNHWDIGYKSKQGRVKIKL